MGRAISGAGVRLLINGTEVGFATGVSVSESINQAPVEVLGNIDVEEHVPVGRTVTMTADFVRIRQESLQVQGVWPRGTTVQVLDFPEMEAAIYDVVNDTPIYKVDGVVPETRNWRVDRGTLVTKNCTFRCRRLYDEVDA